MKRFFKILIITLLLITLIFFLSLKISNFLENSKDLDKYHNYFNKPLDEQKVEGWMTFSAVKHNFNLDRSDIEKILNKNIKFRSLIGTIDDYCIKNNLNCTEVINNFNNYIDKRNNEGNKND